MRPHYLNMTALLPSEPTPNRQALDAIADRRSKEDDMIEVLAHAGVWAIIWVVIGFVWWYWRAS